jgi:hypothetical protein
MSRFSNKYFISRQQKQKPFLLTKEKITKKRYPNEKINRHTIHNIERKKREREQKRAQISSGKMIKIR